MEAVATQPNKTKETTQTTQTTHTRHIRHARHIPKKYSIAELRTLIGQRVTTENINHLRDVYIVLSDIQHVVGSVGQDELEGKIVSIHMQRPKNGLKNGEIVYHIPSYIDWR